jgi:hypothetical protein
VGAVRSGAVDLGTEGPEAGDLPSLRVPFLVTFPSLVLHRMPAASSARTSCGLLRPASSWLEEAGPYERCRRQGCFPG